MTPDDRVAAITCLVLVALLTIIVIIVAEQILTICREVPVVTKDPHTGQLYIPRSDLTVGPRTRRHHGTTQSRP